MLAQKRLQDNPAIYADTYSWDHQKLEVYLITRTVIPLILGNFDFGVLAIPIVLPTASSMEIEANEDPELIALYEREREYRVSLQSEVEQMRNVMDQQDRTTMALQRRCDAFENCEKKLRTENQQKEQEIRELQEILRNREKELEQSKTERAQIEKMFG